MKVLKTNKYNPGSLEAVFNGCICPQMNYANGKPSEELVYNMACPLHTADLTLDDKGLQIN